MLQAVTNGITTVIGWIGTVITALTDTTSSTPGALTPLLPLFAVGIAVSAILLGVKMVKSIVWGA